MWKPGTPKRERFIPGRPPAAGNYAITNLPVGTYELTVKVSGFKTYTHTNLALAAAQVLREDIPLQVGETTESITVEAQASLLKTETGELGDNVTVEQMVDSPLLGIGTVNSGTSGVRNPYNVLQTLPGVTGYNAGGTVGGPIVVNGLGGAQPRMVSLFLSPRPCASKARTPPLRSSGTTFTRRWPSRTRTPFRKSRSRPATTLPKSGQAGTAVINMTMKSGTNQYHGTGFDYFVNEDPERRRSVHRQLPTAQGKNGPATAATISAAPWAVPSSSPNSITGRTRPSSSSPMRSTWKATS